ncbi:unnamed protein product [Nezara viridula]|uniref:Uncharacterized protein n=1 Tax=Nezara viridula TaxID=85310 RepID=A0A9P0HQ71_NEZVI|nr:unnamed protein product [Nezara viridula]
MEALEARVTFLEAALRAKQLELEALERQKDLEILELKSLLDKFQSVIPYHINQNNNTVYRKGETRRRRAQGISAEPLSEEGAHLHFNKLCHPGNGIWFWRGIG